MPGGRLLLALALALVLTTCAVDASAQVRLADVASFSGAVYATSPPGDSRRLFVVEQGGRIHVVRDGVKLAEPFLDIDPLVLTAGEQGLLSMAFAPDYATSRRFYVYYTGNEGDNHVAEYQRSATDLDKADPASHRPVIDFPHPTNTNHNGGQLQFGPDGFLYIATGDGGAGNDPPNNAQTLASPLGKLLRIDPAVPAGYAIPPGNPFVGDTRARPEVWAYGLRNPWRFSFDRQTGDLVIADVGQNRAEEVDWSPASAGRGAAANYGWRCYEGFANTPTAPDCNPPEPPDHVPPVIEKLHADTSTDYCAIVGGYVVRDPTLGPLVGRYVYGDNCEDRLSSLNLADRASDAFTGHSVGGLTSFGEDACGRVYAVSFNVVRRFEGNPPATCELPDPYPSGSGDTPPPPPGSGTVDATPPTVSLTRRRVQRILRQRGVRIGVGCNESCELVARGTISIPLRAAKVFRLKRRTRTLAAGVRVKLKLRLRKRAVRPLRRALARRRRVRARITVTARDLAGNSRTRRARVRARR